VVQLPRQLADFLGEPREVRQRREVSFLILTDPPIHGLLGFAQGHRRLRAIVNAELPPLVAPFRGERYAGGDRLSALIAPPYDVISREDRARYAALDPHNIVHLILPEAPSGGGGDRYAHAAALLAQWRASGVVQPDAGDSVYVVAQDYALPSGERRTRIGMFAAVRAEPFEARRGLPRRISNRSSCWHPTPIASWRRPSPGGPPAYRRRTPSWTACGSASGSRRARQPPSSPGWPGRIGSTSRTGITVTRRRSRTRESTSVPIASSRSSSPPAIRASPSSRPTASCSVRGATLRSWSPAGGNGSRSGEWHHAWTASSGWPTLGAGARRASWPYRMTTTSPWC